MFGWAVFLGIVALVAAILGFGGIAGALANVAVIIFVIAAALSLLFIVLGWKGAKSVTGS